MYHAVETTRAQLKAITSEGKSEAKVNIVKQRSHSRDSRALVLPLG